MTTQQILDVFTTEQIEYLSTLPEVLKAKEDIDKKYSGTVYFNVRLSDEIKTVIKEKLNLDLLALETIPMRWIKGDTQPHLDVGAQQFDNTHLIYLTDSQGDFVVDNKNYPISCGAGYIFSESVYHKTVNTGLEPRLLLGPMSEAGLPVGLGITISADGETQKIYIYQELQDVKYRVQTGDVVTEEGTIAVPAYIQNQKPAISILEIIFETDITITSDLIYFVCNSRSLQFGQKVLNNNGDRTQITISGVTNYPGLIKNGNLGDNGYGYIFIFNLFVTAVESTLLNTSGWIGQVYFGYNAGDNANPPDIYIANCASDGDISENSGGILGSSVGFAGAGYLSNLIIVGCSSTGNLLGGGSGGIVGQGPGQGPHGFVSIQSSWSEGDQDVNALGAGGICGSFPVCVSVSNCYSLGDINNGGGGILGNNAGLDNRTIYVSNCYSQGNIGQESGGIIGSFAGKVAPCTIILTNCYTSGSINGQNNAGGIIGPDFDYNRIAITNTYSAGVNNDNVNGNFYGGSNAVPPGADPKCTHTNGWSDNSANTDCLSGFPFPNKLGVSWIKNADDTPYELYLMGYTPYTTANLGVGNFYANLQNVFTTNVQPGNKTVAGLKSGNNKYSIIEIDPPTNDITIDSFTGEIITQNTLTPGSYTVFLRNTGSYNISYVVLEVNPAPCFLASNKLLLSNGELKAIKDIKQGDTVKGASGKDRIVKHCGSIKLTGELPDYNKPRIIPSDYFEQGVPNEPVIISGLHALYTPAGKLFTCQIKDLEIVHSLEEISLRTNDDPKYYHIVLDDVTDAVMCHNLPVESTSKLCWDAVHFTDN